MSDPRVFFAAERTLLAWIRTGLTVMAFGFVVARFGLFLSLMMQQRGYLDGTSSQVQHSQYLGLALILVGMYCIFSSVLQHRSFLKSLRAEDLPANYRTSTALVCGTLLGIIGLLVAGFLVLDGVV